MQSGTADATELGNANMTKIIIKQSNRNDDYKVHMSVLEA